jgi:ComF family protein
MLRWLSITEQALFPTTCLLCALPGQSYAEAPGMDLCARCESDLPINRHACLGCAQPLTGRMLQALCGECLKRPPRVAMTYCAYRYGFPIDHLLRGLKYGGQLVNARVLGGLLSAHLVRERTIPLPDCVIPVPLAAHRFHQRGFNQSIEIGRTVTARLGLQLCTDVVERIRETSEQAGLDRIARRKNLRKAFAVNRKITGRVAILDDVVTTGSTANELARVLLKAGASEVELWAVAKVA